jgi:hypothetical protein
MLTNFHSTSIYCAGIAKIKKQTCLCEFVYKNFNDIEGERERENSISKFKLLFAIKKKKT